MIGTYVLSAGYYDAYYLKAQKVRTLIKRDFEQAFEQVDLVLTPATPSPAFRIGDKMDDPIAMWLNDVFTVTGNLAGLPGISVPAGLSAEGLPLGLQLIGRPFDEATVLRAADVLERAADVHGQAALPGRGGGAMSEARRNDHLIQGATGPWEVVVGLEVHAQVVSDAKLFSGAAAAFGGAPNAHVSPIDAGMPGMLPSVNRRCIEQAVKTGLGLRAEINRFSVFERKNYFYPDLPNGYQISQYAQPLVGRGKLIIDLPDGTAKEVGITRLHVEMDAGKSLHDQRPDATLVDLNRSGVALMEIVSEPDIRSAEQAVAFMRKLRSILRYLGTCDGNMEEGNLRCDANVSVRRPGDPLGTRCEVKNLNSMRFVGRAIEHEARRQVDLLEAGGTIEQETRLFDAERGETRSMRTKEEAHDYRYFPDPDLLPLELDEAFVAAIERTLPELPDAKKARFMRRVWSLRLRRRGAGRGEGLRRLLRGGARRRGSQGAAGARRRNPRRARPQAGRELAADRAVRRAQPGRARSGALPDHARPARPPGRSDPVRHDLGSDRQGRVRPDVRDRRGSGDDRRAEGPEADLGCRRARADRRPRSSPPTPIRWRSSRATPKSSAGSSAR